MNALEKKIYAVMKAETKARKIKLSAQQDLYQKVDPYFLRAFYFCQGLSENGDVLFSVDIGVKYWRYDELKEGITSPEKPFHSLGMVQMKSCRNYAILCRIISQISKTTSYGKQKNSMVDWIIFTSPTRKSIRSWQA